MPGDAKLGLVVGLGVVLTVAVVFFRKDGIAAPPAHATAAAVLPIPAEPVAKPKPAAKTPAKPVPAFTTP